MVSINIVFSNDKGDGKGDSEGDYNDEITGLVQIDLNHFGMKIIDFLLDLWNKGLAKYIGIKINIDTPQGWDRYSVYMIDIDKIDGFVISQEDTTFKEELNQADLYNSILFHIENTGYEEMKKENTLSNDEFEKTIESVIIEINECLVNICSLSPYCFIHT
jgi:hypothetical protein